jgi:hypothetical protein
VAIEGGSGPVGLKVSGKRRLIVIVGDLIKGQSPFCCEKPVARPAFVSGPAMFGVDAPRDMK